MTTRRALITVFCWLAAATSAWRSVSAQEGFVLVVNRANSATSLKTVEISKIFLRKQIKWPDGQQAKPVDQVESSPVRRRFSDAVHHMDVPSVKSYWQELVFSGRGDPPPERASDADVIAFVRANALAIGYVSATAPTSDVKVLTIVP